MWIPDLEKYDGPKYRVLLSAIKDAVRAGELADGDKLPPIREVAFQLGMTPATVVRAYQIGIDEGMLEARVGDGTYVKSLQSMIDRNTRISSSLYDLPYEDGYNLRTASVPRVGQDQLLNDIMGDIIQAGGFHVTRYTNNEKSYNLKKALADFLNKAGFNRSADDILLTQGATVATALTANFLSLGVGSVTALVDDVSYVGFRDLEVTGHVKLHSVEVDDQGMIPDSLREACRAHNPRFIVTSSVAQNPYSVTMSEARMREIIEIAEEFDFQIIDDVIHAHLIKGAWKSLKDFSDERVWTVTSLSKLGYPALQTGVIIPPVAQYKAAQNFMIAHNIRVNEIKRPIVEALLSSDRFYELVEQTRDEVAARHEIIHEAFKGFDYQVTEGAPFFWLRLPSHWSVLQFVAELASKQILIASADTFSLREGPESAVRLTVGGPLKREDFQKAIDIVKETLLRQTYERVV